MFDMRSVLVQFQPDRLHRAERQVLDALRAEFPEAHFEAGEDDGRYWNILFESESPAAALARANVVLTSTTAGRAARRSCIVSCEGAHAGPTTCSFTTTTLRWSSTTLGSRAPGDDSR